MSDPTTPAKPTATTTPFVPPTPITPLPSSVLSAYSTPQQYREKLVKQDLKRAQLLGMPTNDIDSKQTSLGTIEENNIETHTDHTHEHDEYDTEQTRNMNNNNQHYDNVPPDVDERERQFDQTIIEMQNQNAALQAQLQHTIQQLSQLQYEASIYRYHAQTASNYNANFNIIKNIAKPDTFNGDHKSDPDTWVASMRNYLALSGTPHEIQARAAATYLRQAAAQWYNTLPVSDRAQLVDFEALARLILVRFRPLDVVAQARRKLIRLTQTGSVEAFNQQFMALMQLIPTMDKEERIACYRGKLKFELQKQLVTQEYGHLSDIMNVALRTDALFYEHNMIGRRSNMNDKQFKQNNHGKYRAESHAPTSAYVPVNNIEIDESQISNNDEEQSQQAQGSLHYVAIRPMDDAERQRCRENKLCFRCRKPGHRSTNCTAFTSSSTRSVLKPSADISSKKY